MASRLDIRPVTVPPPARTRRMSAHLVNLAAALALWAYACSTAKFSSMGSYGLVSLLGWAYFASLGLVVLGLILEIVRDVPRPSLMVAYYVMLVFVLFGTSSAIEPLATQTVSWLHAGFTQYVIDHGQPLNNFDGRFSWPGVFSMSAVLSSFMGQHSVIYLLRWFPVIIELAYMAPVLAIARYSGVSRRAGWLGVALFYSADWIYQDNFSPQAINYLFYLTTIASVLMLWRPRSRTPLHLRGLMRHVDKLRDLFSIRRIEGRDAVSTLEPRPTIILTAILFLIAAASAMSHQLTPYALILALLACLGARRLGSPEFLVLVVLATIGWLSLGASNYWLAHLSGIFGSIGQLGQSFGSNVSQRVVGSVSHRNIVDLRIVLTFLFYLAAGLGMLWRRTSNRVLELLMMAPFVLLVFQNYGGEGLLRIVLFGLPFTSMLAASLIFPNRVSRASRVTWRRRPVPIATIVSAFALLATCATLMVVVRGGNDAYESFTLGELDAVNYVYNHQWGMPVMGVVAPYMPLEFKDINTFQVSSVAGGETPTLQGVTASLLYSRPTFIILSQSQERWGELVAGYPKNWESGLEKTLLKKDYRVVATFPTATVLKTTN